MTVVLTRPSLAQKLGSLRLAKDEGASTLTCLSRLETSARASAEAAEVTMKPTGLVKKLSKKLSKAHRQSKLRKKRVGSRFSLMESRESNSSLRGLVDVKKNLSAVNFAGMSDRKDDSIGHRPKASPKAQKRRPRVDATPKDLHVYSFDQRSASATSTKSESSFGTKLSKLLQSHDAQVRGLKSKQKEELQALLRNISKKKEESPKPQVEEGEEEVVGCAPQLKDFRVLGQPSLFQVNSIGEEKQSSLKLDGYSNSQGCDLGPFDSIENNATAADDLGDVSERQEKCSDLWKPPTLPPAANVANMRKTPRRTGNGRQWHGYDSKAKGWWMA